MNASTRMYPGTARVSRLFLVTAVLTVVLGGAASLQQLDAQGPPTYRILVTNDDGVRAPGLAALVEALAPLGSLRSSHLSTTTAAQDTP